MKHFCTEFGADYATYSFGYRNFIEREPQDSLAGIYAAGHLPYSALPDRGQLFYMARSVRVDMERYVPGSENRRVLKKFENTLTGTTHPASEFDTEAETFRDFCLDYFEREHGPGIMSPERLRHILALDIANHIVCYRDGQGIAKGYVFWHQSTDMAHYWFSFYAADMARTGFGMYMMLDCTRQAAARGSRHHYLGTAYGNAGRYKMNFPALEFWDGRQWSGDMAQLKSLVAADVADVTSSGGNQVPGILRAIA